MSETVQQSALEKIKSQAEAKFESVKVIALQLNETAKNITIADETTLAMANQLLSKIKDHEKATDERRKALKKPYYDAGIIIDKIAKEILNPLQEGLDIGKVKLREWNDKQTAILNAAKEEDNKKFALLEKIVAQLKEKVQLADTIEKCNALVESIIAKFPAKESFGIHSGTAESQREFFIQSLLSKAAALKMGKDVTVLNEAVKTVETDKIEVQSEMIVAPKSAVRKTWKAVVVDHDKLPRMWLMPNMDAINDYLRINKESLQNPVLIDGVKFYVDEAPIIK